MILIFENNTDEEWRVQLNIFDNFQVGHCVNIDSNIIAFRTPLDNDEPGENQFLPVGDYLITGIVHFISKNEHFETVVTKNVFLKSIL